MFRYPSIWLVLIVGGVVIQATGWIMSVLGIPFLYSGGVILAMGITFAYLYFRGYETTSWLLVFCVAGALIGAIGLVRTFVFPDDADAPFGLYDDYWESFEEFDRVPIDQDVGLVFPGFDQDYDAMVRIDYPEIDAMEGQWRFIAGEADVTGVVNGIFEVDPTLNEVTAYRPNEQARIRQVEPFMWLELPLYDEHIGEEVDISATVEIEYWIDHETLTRDTFSRDVTVRVADSLDYFDDFGDQYLLPLLCLFGSLISPVSDGGLEAQIGQIPYAIVMALIEIVSLGGAFYLITVAKVLSLPGSRTSSVQFVRAQPKGGGLGVEVYSVDRVALGPDSPTAGAFVGMVLAQSPAGRAGIRSQDVITRIDAEEIKTPNQVIRIAKRAARGDMLSFTLWRDGEVLTLWVKF